MQVVCNVHTCIARPLTSLHTICTVPYLHRIPHTCRPRQHLSMHCILPASGMDIMCSELQRGGGGLSLRWRNDRTVQWVSKQAV